MYYFEWLTWSAKLEDEETRKKDEAALKKFDIPANNIFEDDILKEQTAAKKTYCDTPKSRGPVYEYNENVVELRCGLFEPHRGYLTILSLSLAFFSLQLITGTLKFIISGSPTFSGNPFATYSNLLFPIFTTGLMAALFSFLYVKYGIPISRLELFTSRHLLIRFNRTTQQVHLHRPKSCGGIATLPWIGISSTGAENEHAESAGLDVPLFVSWSPDITRTHHTEIAAIGRRGKSQTELRSEWEFIRRFMDEGPENLPRPKITSHFPWPWQAFRAQFEGQSNTWSNANGLIRLGLIMISPALLLFGTAHWISLMLCWKPRWPKIIREAGQPGKPIPPFTTLADYPEHIQQRLRENAHLWAPIPGNRPENCHGKLSTVETTKDEA